MPATHPVGVEAIFSNTISKSYTKIEFFSRPPNPLTNRIGYYTNIYRWILLEYEISLKYKKGFFVKLVSSLMILIRKLGQPIGFYGAR